MRILQQLQEDPISAITYLLLILVSTLLHEYGHALVGYREGDDANTSAGKFIWNPQRYLNWMGIALLLLVGFGFLGQAAVHPWKLRRGRLSEALVAAAGPLVNVLLVVLAIVGLKMIGVDRVDGAWVGASSWLAQMFLELLRLNIVLAVFNALPIPPLDGSRVLAALAPGAVGESLRAFLPQTSQYAFVFMVLLSQPIGQLMNAAIAWVIGSFL